MGHGRGGHGDHRDRPGRRVGAELSERRDAVHARELDVHQHQIRDSRLGQAHPVLAGPGFDRLVALVLEHVAHQLQVLLVVLDDQDQLVGHMVTGSVNVNVAP